MINLNARTETLPDYVESDSANYMFHSQTNTRWINSYFDAPKINENGKELVDLCISANLGIISMDGYMMIHRQEISHAAHTEETV